MDIILSALLLFAGAGFVAAIGAAYRNGVVDGYGYAKEPYAPGYAKAGDILQTMSHRWPELADRKADVTQRCPRCGETLE